MSLDYAKFRLNEWGRWSRDPAPLRSSMGLWFRGSRSSQSNGNFMPDHIQHVDGIVSRLSRSPRIVIIVHYCRQGSGRDKAISLGIPRTTYFRNLEEGHWFVHTELDGHALTSGTENVLSHVS